MLKYFENIDTKKFYSEKLLSNEEKEKGQIKENSMGIDYRAHRSNECYLRENTEFKVLSLENTNF